jgi:aminoglycoside 6'-N-acetyltransferase I
LNEFINNIKKVQIEKCAEVYVKVNNAEPWNDEWTLETAYRRLNDIYTAPNFAGVLYVENGEVEGAILGNYEQFFDGMHYNLREMFVSNELQRTGIGSKMLRTLEGQLKLYGVTTIILFTSKGNGTSRFYLKNGFGEWDNMVIMGKGIS